LKVEDSGITGNEKFGQFPLKKPTSLCLFFSSVSCSPQREEKLLISKLKINKTRLMKKKLNLQQRQLFT